MVEGSIHGAIEDYASVFDLNRERRGVIAERGQDVVEIRGFEMELKPGVRSVPENSARVCGSAMLEFPNSTMPLAASYAAFTCPVTGPLPATGSSVRLAVARSSVFARNEPSRRTLPEASASHGSAAWL